MEQLKSTYLLCALLLVASLSLWAGCSGSNDTCETHRDCSRGQVCSIDGQCKVLSCDQCQSQSNLVCLTTEAHPEGVCSRPECLVDGDCSGAKPFCVGGVCSSDQCTGDDQCLEGQICTAFGRCAADRGDMDAGGGDGRDTRAADTGASGGADAAADTGTGAGADGGNDDTGAGPSCADVSCPGDQFCDPQTGQCRESTCTNKKDCSMSPNPDAKIWDPMLCACVECRGGGDCGGGQECRGGICRAPCQQPCSGSGCSGDKPYCISGCCTECVGNSDCARGEICADGTCRQESAGCASDPSSCPAGTSCNMSSGKCESSGNCPGGGSPSPETCNNKDDDCDGRVDEGVTRQCGSSTGACIPGTETCSAGQWGQCSGAVDPSNEICNGRDDDCDGRTDEGINCNGNCQDGTTRSCGRSTGACQQGQQTCRGGRWGSCQGGVDPTRETCNGKDDDCDGRVDEFLTQRCGKDTGACRSGTKQCKNGQWTACQGSVGPTAEKCNYSDDDCDGQVDEGNPEGGQSCDTGRSGVCAKGITTCSFGRVRCEAQQTSSSETCNGKDDDCDGRVDEYVDRRCGKSTGECRRGRQECSMGQWGPCKGGQGPTPEVCDGDDNDCDGQDDEGLTSNKPCQDQQGVCAGATRTCKYGYYGSCDSKEYGPEYESYESSCGDGKDNDCDGDVDCKDSSCGGDACGLGQGASCGYLSDTCEEDACYDGKDNDQDGKTDCQDPDCGGCRSGATCDMATGRCMETDCEDFSDNDRDGKRNCQDPDCQGKRCSGCYYCGGSQAKTCSNGSCNCTNALSCP